MDIGPLYLSLYDVREPGPVRRCQLVRRVSVGTCDDAMLIAINPPLIGQSLGLGGKDIEHVVVISRWAGRTLFPVSEWPMHVYVLLPTVEPDDRESFQAGEYRLIYWACLHQSYDEAAEAVRAERQS